MSNDITWDEDIQWDDKAPIKRRETTLRGSVEEAAKGVWRPIAETNQFLGQHYPPMQAATGITKAILDKIMPGAGGKLEAFNEQVRQRVQPAPDASRVEQALGTTAELGTSMLPFMGASKASSMIAPIVGGVAGEQVGGDMGKLIGSLLAPAGQVAAGRMFRPQMGPPAPADALKVTGRQLHEAGLPVLPSQTQAGPISKALEAYGVSAKNASRMREKAQPVLREMAASEAGTMTGPLLPKNITAEALSAANRNISAATYQPIKDLGTVNLTITPRGATPFRQELGAISNEFRHVEKARDIRTTINGLREPRLTAEATIERIQQLRDDAGTAFRSGEVGNRTYGKALRKIADALENQVERNFAPGSKAVEAYRAGRMQIAKNNAVKDMLVDPKTGLIDTTAAHKLREDGVKLTGKLDMIADAGSPVFSAATKPPIGAEPTALTLRDAVLMGTPWLARRATQSGMGQFFATRVPPPSKFGGMATEYAQRFPGAIASPFFSQGDK